MGIFRINSAIPVGERKMNFLKNATQELGKKTVLPLWHSRWIVLPVMTSITMMAMLIGAVLAAPREVIEGDVQRLMYIHVPSAINAYLAFGITATASAIFLINGKMRWDAIARASAGVGILLTLFILSTGAIWGKPIWGIYWTWDARLTSTLVLLLIYCGYLLVRSLGNVNDTKVARYAAIVGLIGYLDIPLIHFSVDWWRTLHPQRIVFDIRPALPAEMLIVLGIAFLAVLSLVLWLILLSATTEYLHQQIGKLSGELDQMEN